MSPSGPVVGVSSKAGQTMTSCCPIRCPHFGQTRCECPRTPVYGSKDGAANVARERDQVALELVGLSRSRMPVGDRDLRSIMG